MTETTNSGILGDYCANLMGVGSQTPFTDGYTRNGLEGKVLLYREKAEKDVNVNKFS